MKGVPWTDEQKAAARERIRNRRREAQNDAAPAGEATAAPFTDLQVAEELEAKIAEVWGEPSPPPLSEYDRFIATLDDETRALLDDMELRAIFAASQKKIKEEKRDQLRKRVAERALHEARVSEGLLPKEAVAQRAWRERMAESVTFTPHLPESCYMQAFGCAALVVDGRIIRDGIQTTCTRGEFMSYREQVWRAQQGELDFEGRGRLHHLRRQRLDTMEIQGLA